MIQDVQIKICAEYGDMVPKAMAGLTGFHFQFPICVGLRTLHFKAATVNGKLFSTEEYL